MKKFCALLLILIICFTFVSCSFNQTNEQNLVILLGQSNADGYCLSANLPARLYAKYSNDKSLYKIAYSAALNVNSNFVPVSIGQGASTSCSGPEIGIAEELEANHIPASIIKYSYGGTSLAYDWLNSFQGGTSLYDRALSFIKERLVTLMDQGITITNICVCWMQGEADEAGGSDTYEANMETFVSKLKTDLADCYSGNFFFVDACIQEAWIVDGRVNEAKKSFASKHTDFVYLIPENATLFTHSSESTKDSWGGSIDGRHIDMQGEYNLGREFIKGFIALMK